MSAQAWLAAGLGNPGDTYEGTRHNVGRDAVRRLADTGGGAWSSNRRIRCRVARVRLGGGQQVRLVLPRVAMNLSGGPVQQAASWFDVPVERLVVLHDDLDLELGAIRLKQGGGHGGHNGLRDLDRALGCSDYLRVRIGIGRPPPRQPPRDYVLSGFPPGDRQVVATALDNAAAAVETLVTEGLEPAQNRFHGLAAGERG